MPLENANNISQIDDRYPLPSDPGSRGDDHLRLIKSVLKKQFPGKDGNGFNTPITLTEEFLNGLPAAIQSLQDKMDKRWPVGCLLLLVVSTDPNGDYPGTWERIKVDASLHINPTDAAPGPLTGSNTPTVPVPKHSHVAKFTGQQMEPHSHPLTAFRQGGDWHVGQGPNTIYSSQFNTSSVTAGTPKGAVTVDDSGTQGATIDVRGQRLLVNVWKRTA